MIGTAGIIGGRVRPRASVLMTHIADDWPFYVVACVLAVLLLPLRQILTGDEPRYLMYATALLKYGRFVMTMPEWSIVYHAATKATADSLPTGGGGVILMNGVYLPTLLAPVGRLFGLDGLRAATLLSGLVGLFYLLQLCRLASSRRTAWLAVVVAGFSVPLLPYLHLFYMETFMFALVCVTWHRLQSLSASRMNQAITVLLLVAIPFVHMRGSVVAAALYFFLVWRIVARGQIRWAVTLVVPGLVALGILIVSNTLIYGAVTGPVNSARPPLPSQWFAVLSMQLFNVRHGLFAFAPIWMLGYAGLFVGAIRGSVVAREGLLLAFIAAITGVGVNPGECWPARFWVLSVPMVTVGLAVWWQQARSPVLRVVSLLLLVPTLANALLFFRAPNAFLENRQTTMTYQILYDKLGYLDPGLILPVEYGDPRNVAVASCFAFFAMIFILLMVLAVLRRWPGYALLGILLPLTVFDLSRVSTVSAADYGVTRAADQLGIALHRPTASGYVQFGRGWQTWYEGATLLHFDVATRAAGGAWQNATLPANQVIAFACSAGVDALSILLSGGDAAKGAFNLADQADYRLVVYRSQSLLRRLLAAADATCG